MGVRGVIAVVAVAAAMRAQGGLPAGAVVIEREAIPASAHTERELVLWMISPEKHDRGPYSEKNPYMCPERTRGSYFSGPTRISLVDTRSGKTINTVVLRSSVDEADTFDVPYRILADWPYLVPGTPKDAEGKPHLLALRDLNGDGLALETAFFEAIACMGLPSTLIGYSPRQDKVIQYQVELKVTERKMMKYRNPVTTGRGTMSTVWPDYLFYEKPSAPGRWSYGIDYRGRAGTLDTYEIRYDAARERFVGTLDRLAVWDD